MARKKPTRFLQHMRAADARRKEQRGASSPVVGRGGARIDIVGRRVREHLVEASRSHGRKGGWRLDVATPKSHWLRRFRLTPTGWDVYYNEIEDAFVAIDSDDVIERAMKGHSMSIMVRVNDPSRKGALWFTTGLGPYNRAMQDTLDNTAQWVLRYGRAGDGPGAFEEEDDEDSYVDDDASIVKEIVILVGRGPE